MSRKTKVAALDAGIAPIPKDWIDQYVTGPMSGEEVNARLHGFQESAD